MDKTIIFCVDEEHADRMRTAMINENLDMVEKDDRYVMRITGTDKIGKYQLDNFINPRKQYPTIVTTSKLLTTGVDVKTCKLIVIDATINSMVEFKQIIGRGTRIAEDFDKVTFTIIDFTGATELFKDPKFDGDTDIILIDPPVNGKGTRPPVIPIDPPAILPPKKKVKRPKIKLPNEKAYEVYRQEKLIDEHGELITENFLQYVKNKLTDEFETYAIFKQYWDQATLKELIIKQLEAKDIYMNVLEEEVGEEYDPFDLLVHVAYEKPALTRSQRARKVRKNESYFDKYGEKAKEVINILLDKYVDKGLEALENVDTLKTPELQEYGTVPEITMDVFGGVQVFKTILQEIKKFLYMEVR
jgi:type I restriction enzyme R subunit